MSKIYLFFVHKKTGHVSDSPVFKLLSKFATYIRKNDTFMVSLPGFMSTDKTNISKFCNKIKHLFPNAYFTKGMNGKYPLPGSTNVADVQNSFFNNMGLSIKTKRDHSKMMFFFKLNGSKKVDNFNELKKLKCFAILIGSSNQSHQTYFGNLDKRTGLLIAPYGEADALLLDIDFLKKQLARYCDSESDSIALSLQESLSNYSTTVFKEIKDASTIENIINDVFE